jgi:hypothetical protein
MIQHTYHLCEGFAQHGYSGLKYTVEPTEYLTNDSGEGIFYVDAGGALKQVTGNGQFCGDRAALLRWLNRVYGGDSLCSEDRRYFNTARGAQIYANRQAKKHPLRKLPIPQFAIGTTLHNGGIVESQDGEQVMIRMPAQPADGMDSYRVSENAFEIY